MTDEKRRQVQEERARQGRQTTAEQTAERARERAERDAFDKLSGK